MPFPASDPLKASGTKDEFLALTHRTLQGLPPHAVLAFPCATLPLVCAPVTLGLLYSHSQNVGTKAWKGTQGKVIQHCRGSCFWASGLLLSAWRHTDCVNFLPPYSLLILFLFFPTDLPLAGFLLSFRYLCKCHQTGDRIYGLRTCLNGSKWKIHLTAIF